jgi:iron-sulfur cluster repair protein YtfE (RIC family)
MPTYKLQVQDDDQHPDVWRDVKSSEGLLVTFTKETEAREKLAELFPVLVKMEQFHADRKRTRVVVMNPYQDLDQEKEE